MFQFLEKYWHICSTLPSSRGLWFDPHGSSSLVSGVSVSCGSLANPLFNKLELQIYSIRHIQQHAGELMERLGSRAGIDVDWVGRVR